MIWIWLAIGVFVFWLLARLASPRPKARGPAQFERLDDPPPRSKVIAEGPRTVRELGEKVGRDRDDRAAPARKLVDNFNVGIEFEYRNADGFESHRKVMIDGVYGDSLDWPLYVLGYDTLTRERRTFNLERITALHRQDGGAPFMDAIPYWIGGLVRQEVGLPHPPEPFERTLDAPIVVTERHAETKAERTRVGRATGIRMSYSALGRILELEVWGRLGKAAPSRKLYKLEPDRGQLWRVAVVACGDTGEVIDDLVAWFSEQSAATAA